LFLQITAYRQTNIRGFGFGSVPVTALLVYLFQLVPVTFTYLRTGCPCDVTTFLDLTSFMLLTGSGRVGSRVKNPDPVPSLPQACQYKSLKKFGHSWQVRDRPLDLQHFHLVSYWKLALKPCPRGASRPMTLVSRKVRAKLHYTDTGYGHHQRTSSQQICHIAMPKPNISTCQDVGMWRIFVRWW